MSVTREQFDRFNKLSDEELLAKSDREKSAEPSQFLLHRMEAASKAGVQSWELRGKDWSASCLKVEGHPIDATPAAVTPVTPGAIARAGLTPAEIASADAAARRSIARVAARHSWEEIAAKHDAAQSAKTTLPRI